jgi:hypothetical protein
MVIVVENIENSERGMLSNEGGGEVTGSRLGLLFVPPLPDGRKRCGHDGIKLKFCLIIICADQV